MCKNAVSLLASTEQRYIKVDNNNNNNNSNNNISVMLTMGVTASVEYVGIKNSSEHMETKQNVAAVDYGIHSHCRVERYLLYQDKLTESR